MPHPGYVSRDTLRRIFATPITKVESDSIQPSGKEVRDAQPTYWFSQARISALRLLFPSKYADYDSSASHVFVLLWTAIRRKSRAGKTKDGNLLFPRSYDVLFMSGGLILRIFEVGHVRPTSTIRRALLFSCKIARLVATRIYARQTMIRHAPSFSWHEIPVSRRYFRSDVRLCATRADLPFMDSLDPVRNHRFRNCRTSGYLAAISS